MFKWEERKGWRFLLEAFAREFGSDPEARLNPPPCLSAYVLPVFPSPQESALSGSAHTLRLRFLPQVGLYIKTSPYMGADPEREVTSLLEGLANSADPAVKTPARALLTRQAERVRVDASQWAAGAMPTLFAGADAFVLPTRGEARLRPPRSQALSPQSFPPSSGPFPARSPCSAASQRQ